MAMTLIAGSGKPIVVTTSVERSDRDGTTVEVKGLYSMLKGMVPAKGETSSFLPDGAVVNSASLRSDGDGMGTLTINSVAYGEATINTTPDTTTWTIDMAEVQQELQAHPYIVADAAARAEVLLWLATDENLRYNPGGAEKAEKPEDAVYRYAPSGTTGDIAVEYMKVVKEEVAILFCKAYTDGIKTFNRYLPVVSRVSTYKRLPGASMNGASTTGGTAKFSENIGKFDTPDLTLKGYTDDNGNWFKSHDSYEQQGDSTWRRTEQWTFTPGKRHTWIYDKIDTTVKEDA